MIRKEAFGVLEAVSSFGSLLAFFGGISFVSMVQLAAEAFHWLMRRMRFGNSAKNVAHKIPEITTKFSSMLRQLKKDLGDFVKMSSIHGVRNLSRGFGSKIFWSTVITIATSACIFFVRELFDTFDQNRISIRIDSKTWSSSEVSENYLISSVVYKTLFPDPVPSSNLLP